MQVHQSNQSHMQQHRQLPACSCSTLLVTAPATHLDPQPHSPPLRLPRSLRNHTRRLRWLLDSLLPSCSAGPGGDVQLRALPQPCYLRWRVHGRGFDVHRHLALHPHGEGLLQLHQPHLQVCVVVRQGSLLLVEGRDAGHQGARLPVNMAQPGIQG